MAEAAVHEDAGMPWYAGLTSRHWRILWGSYLGWIFDGYEAVALVYALVPALTSILTPEQAQAKPTISDWPSASRSWGGALADYWAALQPIISGANA